MTARKVETVDNKQTTGAGGSSNIIQLGSFVANFLFALIIVVLLWRQNDTDVDKRIDTVERSQKALMDETERHHKFEIDQLRAEIDRMDRNNHDYRNDISMWDTDIFNRFKDVDFLLKANGVHIRERGTLKPPPE